MKKIFEEFENAGQTHVFRFIEKLSDDEKSSLCRQLQSIDLDELSELNNSLVFGKGENFVDFKKLLPAPFEKLPKNKDSDPKWIQAKKIGEEAIKNGKVAAFVVAGGMGTRLGFDAPKGLFPVTPVRGKSLFQVFAEKILSAEKKYNAKIPWLIMTSEANNDATKKFFVDNSFFGLDQNDVIFFKQGLMPAVDSNGKIILESKSKVAMTPDGHGGCLRAMCRSGAIDELEKRGISCVSYFQVDNPLIDIIDPYFIGFHIIGNSQMSSKAIPKAFPLEKVGHFCILDGKTCVIEYSDLPKEYQEMREPNGELLFRAGSVAIHVLDVDFIKSLGGKDSSLKLPFHRADKKIPCVDANGNVSKPDKPNGIKFEMFVFDALPMAKNPVIIEGSRADEFSPVKNAEGVDSPLTCKNDQKKQFARWLEAAGESVPKGSDGTPSIDLEISPLFASHEDEFVAKWKAMPTKPKIENGLYLE